VVAEASAETAPTSEPAQADAQDESEKPNA
jgi:hypothetical protein